MKDKKYVVLTEKNTDNIVIAKPIDGAKYEFIHGREGTCSYGTFRVKFPLFSWDHEELDSDEIADKYFIEML